MGDNDADQSMELNNFTDSFNSLINDLTSENSHIIVSGLLAQSWYQNIDFVDSYNSFLLATCDLAVSYFHREGVHPYSFGIKKMLKNIDV